MKRVFARAASLLGLLGLVACTGGEPCSGGDCAEDCEVGLTECAQDCVDTASDEAHCGGCGESCDTDQTCVAGACEPACGDLLACGEACVDPLTDDAFCGASGDCTGENAGVACDTDQECTGGACVDVHPCDLPPASGTPGVTVSAVSGPATEGGEPVTYTLVLDAQPCDVVDVTLGHDAQIVVEPAALAFTRDDWDTPQTITARAAADAAPEGDHAAAVSHAVASADVGYDGLGVADATVTIVDVALLWHASPPSTAADAQVGGVSDAGVVAFVSLSDDLVADDGNFVADAFAFDVATGTVERLSLAADGSEANGATETVSLSADGAIAVFFSRATNLTGQAVTAAGEFFRVGRSGTPAIAKITPACAGCNQEIHAGSSISADGSDVAFTTRRAYDNTDNDGEFDVYVWTDGGGSPTLESLSSSDGNGAFFWGSNAWSPNLSSTGRYVAFRSAAKNLATPDITVENFHVYVKDRTSRTLTRASLMSGGTANCDGEHQTSSSDAPFVSADGDVVAFQSDCVFTLAAGVDDNGVTDVLVRDVTAQTTTRASVATDGSQADGASGALGISDDGTLVLFWSDATNLVPGDTNGARDLFLRDLAAGTTTRVSVGADYAQIPSGAGSGVISRNGSFVAFATADDVLPSDTDAYDDVYLLRVR